MSLGNALITIIDTLLNESDVSPLSESHPYLFYGGFYGAGSLWTLLMARLFYLTEVKAKKDTTHSSYVPIHVFRAIWIVLLVSTPVLSLVALVSIALTGIVWFLLKATHIALELCLETFLLIHSELRLLCMTDAMLGALIGYVSGHAIVGGIAGAMLGVLNFELVSKRLHKLAPAQH